MKNRASRSKIEDSDSNQPWEVQTRPCATVTIGGRKSLVQALATLLGQVPSSNLLQTKRKTTPMMIHIQLRLWLWCPSHLSLSSSMSSAWDALQAIYVHTYYIHTVIHTYNERNDVRQHWRIRVNLALYLQVGRSQQCQRQRQCQLSGFKVEVRRRTTGCLCP